MVYPPDLIRLSGDGVFATLQGEGVSAGRPSVFVRTQDCNLHCGRDGIGWHCDASYTWDRKTAEYTSGLRLVSSEALSVEVADEWNKTFAADPLNSSFQPNLVLTGGEPMIQQKKLAELLQHLPGWHTEIETNGTIVIDEGFSNAQINCSPKLQNSGNALRARLREKALRAIAAMPDHWFKFVVSRNEDIVEIKDIMDRTNGGDYSRVLLMAEGVDPTQLRSRTDILHDIAAKLGCQVTERNHIYWFGNIRRT